MKNEMITTLVVEPRKAAYVKDIALTLPSLQREVGGHIEVIYPYDEPVALICDAEGKQKGSELNRVLRDEDGQIYDVIAGTFLIAGLGKEDFASLSPKLTQKFAKKFRTPEIFMLIDDHLVVIPMDK